MSKWVQITEQVIHGLGRRCDDIDNCLQSVMYSLREGIKHLDDKCASLVKDLRDATHCTSEAGCTRSEPVQNVIPGLAKLLTEDHKQCNDCRDGKTPRSSEHAEQ